MAVPKPEFTDSFLVESNNYGDFIRIVRQNVIKYCSDRRPGIVQPVLPREEKVPKFWFHVVLRTTTSSITLAIRIDNLYLVGFKTPAGVWWEFNNEKGTHLINGANWLGFGGRYSDLVGEKGLETVKLGRAKMTDAVNNLAKHGTATTDVPEELLQDAKDDPYAVPKSMLVKLVIMICEGLRFETVYRTVDKEFNNMEATITELEGKQVRKWDKISQAVHKWAVNPNAPFPELEEIGIKNKTDAEKIVLLVKDETA